MLWVCLIGEIGFLVGNVMGRMMLNQQTNASEPFTLQAMTLIWSATDMQQLIQGQTTPSLMYLESQQRWLEAMGYT
jgi:hypothetical protein